MSQAPIRILHVVGGMTRGGVETWLMRVLRGIDRRRFRIDFLVHTHNSCDYDEEVRSLGSRILVCPHPSRPLHYARTFREVLRTHGRYDVVHSHVHYYSGFVLRLAHSAGVPTRISHSHSDTSRADGTASLFRRVYLSVSRAWIFKHATHRLAASRSAARALFGPHWQADPRHRILYCGIDLAPFRCDVDPIAMRRSLQIPADAVVIGHVGRFTESKNHEFWISVAADIARLEPRAYFLLIGDGPMRPTVESLVTRVGLKARTKLLGSRPDVPELLLGAMDIMLFPSLYEGLPLALIEAQAAGLPCVISDNISPETDVIPELICRLPLDSQAAWTKNALLRLQRHGDRRAQPFTQQVASSQFSLDNCIQQLQRLYEGG